MADEIEFDPAKEAANIAKHGISLRRASDLDVAAIVEDDRFAEDRLRFYGRIDGDLYCLAAVRRGETLRAISLRRAHRKEYRRYV